MQLWHHIRAILLLPVMAAVVVPSTALVLFGWDTFGVWPAHPALQPAITIFGVLIGGAGLILIVTTVKQFATAGQGTLAPWNPTERLVVQGVYRHVRNPMISGVMCILFGEALASSSTPILIWFGFFAVANAIYIPLSEEPGLVKRFGDEYEDYRRNVPRWIPRLTPWTGKSADA